MALYTTKELFAGLPEGKYAVGAFNVHNMEYTQGVITAAESLDAPVILMLGEPMLAYAGLEMLSTICLTAAKKSKVPVAVTLDHGKDLDIIDECIKLGLSVMFDGSELLLAENIRLTREVGIKAHRAGVSLEGELGAIAGVEDAEEVKEGKMTDPALAKNFVEETGVDLLAVSIGNCHGLYKGEPKLDIERLVAIREQVNVPLVLHGGSDLPENQSKEAVSHGIKKFNIGTDLKYVFAKTLRETLSQEPLPFQPPAVLGPARSAVEATALAKIRLFGSTGVASRFSK